MSILDKLHDLGAEGYTDAEARAAALSRAAGEHLGWLVRLRGGRASDRRVTQAVGELEASAERFVFRKQRGRIHRKWNAREFDADEDTDQIPPRQHSVQADREQDEREERPCLDGQASSSWGKAGSIDSSSRPAMVIAPTIATSKTTESNSNTTLNSLSR